MTTGTAAYTASAGTSGVAVSGQQLLAGLAALAALLGSGLPTFAGTGFPAAVTGLVIAVALLIPTGLAALRPDASRTVITLLIGLAAHLAAFRLIAILNAAPDPDALQVGPGYWALTISAWLAAWLFVTRISDLELSNRTAQRLLNLVIPVLFGAWILILWEIIVRAAHVPPVLLPAPSAIWERILASTDILWADFRQTFLKAVLAGYAMGCGAGFLVAIAVDRVPFLKRGLLPIGNLVSALPIIGVAPIMVMWFGFDWPSKAAVVVVMTFFPMLVNTVAGLAATTAIQRDLMHTYAASPWQTLFKLKLPEALPFIFNALKINSTLALIGAIVAEFFGTPIVGMGFRISTEVGRLNVDMVWAEIAVAALAGSAFYGVIAMIERALTFWHPSYRK